MGVTRILFFRDTVVAEKYLRRHRDQVILIILVVYENGEKDGGWEGAMKRHYGALVLSGLILL